MGTKKSNEELGNFGLAEIFDSIDQNDLKRMELYLKAMDYSKDGNMPHNSVEVFVARCLLGHASTALQDGKIDNDFFITLVEYVFWLVDVFAFSLVVLRSLPELPETNYDLIPNYIKEAILKNEYDGKVAMGISKLSKKAFLQLMIFIGSEVNTLNVRFARCFIRGVIRWKLVPIWKVAYIMGLTFRPGVGCIDLPHSDLGILTALFLNS